MKKIFLALAAAAALFVGCTKELEQRVGDLETSVEKLQSDLKTLEEAVAQKLVVNEMETVENGYKLTFSNGTTVTLQNGAKGDKGETGETGPQGPQGPQGEKGDAFFQKVELSDDGCYLVITLVADADGNKKVYNLPMGAFNIMFDTSDFVDAPNTTVKVPYTISGAKASDVVVRVLSAKNCTAVVDGGSINVTLGEGEAYVDVYAINNATGEIKAKTLTFYGYTVIAQEKVFFVSPAPAASDLITIPVTTDVEYQIEVSDSWIEYMNTETKAELRTDVLVFKVWGENTTEYDRTATITLKVSGKAVTSFDVTQKNYYPQWIKNEEGEQIEWSESFKLSRYSDMSGAETKKGTFHFELSDNFSLGAFKVVGMFYADLYYNNSQMIQNQGGVYYADVEGNVLTIRYAESVKSYGFSKDFEVAYNAGDNSFSLESIKTYNYSNSRDAYIAEYKAAVKVNTPAAGDDSDPIAGTWDITCDLGTAQGTPYTATTGTMVISGSNGSYVIETIAGETYNVNATLDGNTLTSEEKNGATLVFTYDASAKTLTQSGEFVTWELKAVKNIVATKQGASEGGEEGGEDHSALYGEYTENFDDSSYLGYPTKGTLKVEASDDTAHDLKMTFFGGTSVAFTVYADVDGSTITTVNPGTYSGMGLFYESTLTVSGNTIAGTLNFDHPTIPDYSATKAGGSEEEGGETTDEPTFLVGTWDQTVTGMTWPTPSATMTIAVSRNTVTLTDFIAPGTVAVGTYANNTITIAAGTAIGGGNSAAGSLDNELELVVDVDNNTISFPSQFTIGSGYIFIANYSATKQAAVSSGITANDLIGSWQETFEISSYGTYTDSAMTISATDDSSKGQLKVRMLIDETYQEELVCYANLSSDGTKLTVLSNGVAVEGANTFSTNIELTVSEDGKTLSFVGPYVTAYQYHYQNFTATKLN